MTTSMLLFVRDVIFLLREHGAAAAEKFRTSSSELDEGREVAFREVLSTLQGQAIAFDIELADLGLSDPLRDPLSPPR